MNPPPGHPPPWNEDEPAPVAGPDSEAAERADLEEDRRRQRELDDAELGGEA
jgi:hypothetical protein